MNEIRDLIVGIDFGRKSSQICYFDRKAGEPRSISMKVGASQYEAPTCLCRRVEQKDYCVGLEAEYFAREKGGIMIEDLYEICQREDTVQIEGEKKEPWELLAQFLGGMLKFLGIMDVARNIKGLVVTAQELSSVQVSNLHKAFEAMGIPAEKCVLLDYEESFYYYVMTQKKETWNRSVAWYAFTPGGVIFRKLTINGVTKPVLVRIEGLEETTLPMDAEERDVQFFKFAQKTLGSELFSSVQITGEGFSQDWAQQSVKVLCYQKRKVFYGNNLFAKGACAAGKEKLENKSLKNYRYMGESLVLADVGMEMRVMGSPMYYSLIEAGNNWYECRTECEFILDDTEELVFVVSTFEDPQKRRIGMMLPGLPHRPNKTTRLHLALEYISPSECQITVRDVGFGEMFPGTGKEWKETVEW